MDSEVSDIIETYKNLAGNPSPKTGHIQISPNDEETIRIFSTWGIPDLIRAESTKYSREFTLRRSGKFTTISKGIPLDMSSVSLCAFTKSGNRYAIFREVMKDNKKSVYLEIWNSNQKESTFDMSDRKEHGKITQSMFQSFEWSVNEKYLLYIAEAKEKKNESYFKDVFCQKTDEERNEEVTKGEENTYQENWGERCMDAHHTILCIFCVETGSVQTVSMKDMSAAHATWGPKDEYIVFVGYKEVPFRLGVIYCRNRSTSILSYSLKEKVTEFLTCEEKCYGSPVFSPDYETFLFTQAEVGGAHITCAQLMKYEWNNKKISTVLETVSNLKGEDYAGLYAIDLSSRWWSKGSKHFFFHSQRRSFTEIYCVNVSTSKLQKVTIDKSDCGSYEVLDVQDPYILISASSPNVTPHLMIGYFSNVEDTNQYMWSLVDDNSPKILTDLKWNTHTLSPSLPNKLFPDLDFDIVVLSSKEKSTGNLMIFPHGGPHSAFSAGFSVYGAAFARLGYIVCMVNYRGSSGLGNDSIRSVLGNVGTQDVADLIDAIEFLKKDKNLGIKQVVGFGGSHGGFLVAHLVGQHPKLLKAAVMRNPVTDLTSMVGKTDIPDWCWIEAGSCTVYSPPEILTDTTVQTLWEKSPMKYMQEVKTPTLLLLGKMDLRVPPSQGLNFYKYLKALNVPTKLLYFDDDHSLSKVGVSSEGFVHIALWFQKYLSLSSP